MKRLLIILFVIISLLFPSSALAIDIYVNGKKIETDVPAQEIDGRVMVPIRNVAESMGAEVNWINGNVYVANVLWPTAWDIKVIEIMDKHKAILEGSLSAKEKAEEVGLLIFEVLELPTPEERQVNQYNLVKFLVASQCVATVKSLSDENPNFRIQALTIAEYMYDVAATASKGIFNEE